MYLTIDQVEAAIANLVAAYPSLCELIQLPETTIEGRTCHAMRIGKHAATARDGVVIIGGVHAREWGSCEILINLAADLLEAYSTSTGLGYGGKSFSVAEVKAVIESLNLIIFPLVNPDGRKYSQETNALWRKNRNPAQSGGQADRIGVDINRNYDFLHDFAHFAPGVLNGTTSGDTKSEVYHGPSPFSEPETRNVRWLVDMFPRTRWFVDVHCYSRLMLYNWGDDENQFVDPSMSFLNPVYNGLRGKKGDTAYQEFIEANDLAKEQAIAAAFGNAVAAVRGQMYATQPAFDLYPTSGTSDDWAFSRHSADATKGKVYAFTVEWGTEFQPDWAEMERIILDVTAGLIALCLEAPCAGDTITIAQDNISLSFIDVPSGEETVRASVFSVQSCPAVSLRVIDGPRVTSGPGSFGLPLGGLVTLPALPPGGGVTTRQLRIWVSYRGMNPGDATDGVMTVQCEQTGEQFTFHIHANTIARPTVAVVLVLDQSGSMTAGAGDGRTRIQVLRDAAPVFVDVLQEDNGIGIVAFDTDAHDRMDVTTAGPAGPFEPTRINARDVIANHTPNVLGLTAIGDGLERAHQKLDAATDSYDTRAIVVLTDGQETAHKYISDVQAGIINDRVFGIGLGTAEEINPAALTALTNGTGGYVLVTGNMDVDDRFRLSKFYLQILASVTNQQIVRDPAGTIKPGEVHKIPFNLNEADGGSDVILLTPSPSIVRFRLQTPAGQLLDPVSAGAIVGMQFVQSATVAYYRMTLPILVGGSSARNGRWHAVIEIPRDQPGYGNYLTHVSRTSAALSQANSHGLPYSLTIQAISSLRLRAWLTQSSHDPGATMTLRATLNEYDLPVEHRATMTADLTRPDGTTVLLNLPEVEPGLFETTLVAPISGVYHFLLRGEGETLRGTPFTREHILTGAIWTTVAPPKAGSPKGHPCLCKLATCLLGHGVVTPALERSLQAAGLDLRSVRAALAACCGPMDGNSPLIP